MLPDLLYLGNYPSTEAVLSLVSSAAYGPAAAIRAEAVARSCTSTFRVP